MKHLPLLLFLTLSFFSCSNKLSEEDRKVAEEYSGMRQNELGAYQQELIAVEKAMVTAEQRIRDLNEGRYNLSGEDLSVEIELAELRLNDLNEKHRELKRIIEQARKELDSLDVLLQK